MGEETKIEWCDATFNPWTGCTKVSPGCANCYAETLSKRNLPHIGGWGPGAPRKRTSESYWRKPLTWNKKAKNDSGWCARCGFAVNKHPLRDCEGVLLHPRPRVFCASLADWLDPEVPAEWLADLLALIGATPHLDWLLLTKRIEMFRPRLEAAGSEHGDWVDLWLNHGVAPPNVWLGVTVEDQQRADKRIPWLVQIPVRVRFLSCEPLLAPVMLPRRVRLLRRITSEIPIGPRASAPAGEHLAFSNPHGALSVRTANGLLGIKPGEFEDLGVAGDWIICGGESGSGARPMHPDWARSLRTQCLTPGVPFFFKQWGNWVPDLDKPGRTHVRDAMWMTPDGRTGRVQPEAQGCTWGATLGKKKAGRRLDGRTWDQLPQVIGA